MTLGTKLKQLICQIGAKGDLAPDAFALRLERSLQRDGWRAPPQVLFRTRSKHPEAAAR